MIRARLSVLCVAILLAGAAALACDARAQARGNAPAVTSKQKQRAAWMWENRIWREHAMPFLDRAQDLKIGTLFIALDVRGGQVSDRDLLRRFLVAAHARRIAVLAVEGDPHMVLAKGRPAAIARAKAIRAYQQSVAADEQLDGLQYDIEPYVLANFDTADPGDLLRWSNTYRDLRNAFGEKLDIVLPFWIAGTPAGADFVRRAATFASGLTIMAYRTRNDRIIAAATPILDFGVERRRKVRVALEMGPTD
jgi:hypothetical protein